MSNRSRIFSEKEIKSQLNNALGLYRSQKKITVFVEGKTDKEFFVNFINNESPIIFTPLHGKVNVINFLDLYLKEKKYDGCSLFIVDVDYDYLSSKLRRHKELIYSFYCTKENKIFYNDIESYLIINYFDKVYRFLEPTSEINDVINSIERYTRIIGKFRAADDILNCNDISIIDGVDLFEFIEFDDHSWNIVFNELEFKQRLEESSPRKLDIDDLFDKANELDKSVDFWRLSRGHDISKIVHEFFIRHTKNYLLKEERNGRIISPNLEMIFRISSEKSDFWETNVGKTLRSYYPLGNIN